MDGFPLFHNTSMDNTTSTHQMLTWNGPTLENLCTRLGRCAIHAPPTSYNVMHSAHR